MTASPRTAISQKHDLCRMQPGQSLEKPRAGVGGTRGTGLCCRSLLASMWITSDFWGEPTLFIASQ